MSIGEHAFDAVQRLPDRPAATIINLAGGVRVDSRGGHWRARGDDDRLPLTLTRPQEAARLLIGGGPTAAIDRKAALYQHSDEGIVVEPGDRVVDVGAFLGEVALGIRETADEVVCLEPDPRSYAAISETMARFDDVRARQLAAWRESGDSVRFQLAGDPSESGALAPDAGAVVGAVEAETVAVGNLAPIDFLKIEAEGAEPEVLEGLGPGDAAKVAVSVAPERDGESPRAAVAARLLELGYRVVETDSVVFAEWAE